MTTAATEAAFQTIDGASIFYRHWPARDADGQRRAVILLHRGHEHSGRVAHLVDEMGLAHCDFFAWDMRGHGRSSGTRGDADGFHAWTADLDAFVDHVRVTHDVPVEQMVVVAQSVGAVVAAAWVHDYAPRIRALVLASPAFSVKLYVPFARTLLRLGRRLRGNFFVTSYVKPRWLTHDTERQQSYRDDPLITPTISVRMLLGLYDVGDRIVADAAAITTPVLMLVSGKDFVVRRAPQDRFFERLGSRIKQRIMLPGFLHDTLGEKARASLVQRVGHWIDERFEQPIDTPDLLHADRHGPTHDEAERLAWPPQPWSAADIRWKMVRQSIRLGARFSEGLRLGLDTGFDSGSTLDYIYVDQARGRGSLGRLIDRNYLDAIGWRGIRLRRKHVHHLLTRAADDLRAAGQPVRAVDIAAGHGRYTLEALAQASQPADTILLRDYRQRNIDAGRELIRSMQADAIARYEYGDAFDEADLAALSPQPTLAVVSGLYELFADNARVSASLRGLAAAMPAGAFLVYTNQPWHPQLEFIARALTSHRDGQAWVMRRRTQAEMDALVMAAGFRKVAQRIDPWGIFTVSMAVRTGPAEA